MFSTWSGNIGCGHKRVTENMNENNQHPEAPLVSVVDDDHSVRRSTQRLLRSIGLRAEAFASAEEFLASGLAEESACIILDFRMPGMNGLELQRHLAANSIPVPIVFITAHASENEQRQALQAGAVKFLHKPVSNEVLLLAIRSALGNPPIDERKTK
jgi:FixJ family two-component response regulator